MAGAIGVTGVGWIHEGASESTKLLALQGTRGSGGAALGDGFSNFIFLASSCIWIRDITNFASSMAKPKHINKCSVDTGSVCDDEIIITTPWLLYKGIITELMQMIIVNVTDLKSNYNTKKKINLT